MKRNSFSTVSSSLILGAFTFFLFSQTASCGNASYQYWNCRVPKRCGSEIISFPFWISGQQEAYCGWPGFDLACRNDHPILRTPGNEYRVQEIIYKNLSLRVSNDAVSDLKDDDCLPAIANVSIDSNKFEYGPNLSYLFLFSNCSEEGVVDHRVGCGAGKKGAWAMLDNENLTSARTRCEQVVAAPVELQGNDGVKKDYLEVMKRGFLLKWRAYNCTACEKSGGYCGSESSSTGYLFKCFCPDRSHSRSCKNSNPRRSNLPLILGTVIPISFILLLGLVAILYRKKWKYVFSCIFSRSTFSHSSSKADLEGGCIYFGVPVFSYADLEEATKNFNPSKELGDGGFGTVYHGKLRDGREVAVKRMYEHNYKRVNQFMNEIEILTRLRHCNLVSLYGCTSHLSQGLLLVYEYISNGTVADHLHGDRAAEHSLTWPIRMNIALETADALAYLHASDIIHRDVKTTNILLDNNFCVKVADFGLSRLLPTGVTHVSTAPQGTPGYVDPEYYQCYQLTDKSDVYSFGVVLIELILSMPAVDISRDRHEINLSTFAINKIQNHAFDKLIDGSLVPESDSSTKRMITLVAEVAFQCLQLEKEPRPTMDEVLEALKEIRNYKDDNSEGALDSLRSTKVLPSPEADHAVLLRNGKGLRSPNSVTDAWLSCSSTSFSK